MAGMLLLGGSPDNQSRTLLNVPSVTGYNNLAKTWVYVIDPNNVTSDGYPAGSGPATNAWQANPSGFANGYYGDYVWKWSGIGGMQIIGSTALIIKSGTINGSAGKVVFESSVTAGVGDSPSGNQNLVLSGSSGHNTPRMVFAFGFNIQSISDSGVSNGAGGTFIKINCKTNYLSASSFNTLFNVTGAVSNTGANDLWSIVKIDNSSFYLNVSQTTGLPSAFSNAQAGVQGTAVYNPGAPTTQMKDGTSNWSGLTNFVCCKLANETACDNGQVWDADFVTSFTTTLGNTARGNPGILRFMDIIGTQASYDADFSQRMPKTYCFYPTNRVCPGYWVNTITNGGSDNYTCSDPSVSVWNGSSYIDNATVQGKCNVTNTTGNPTLAVGGNPAKPIIQTFDYGPQAFNITAGAVTPGTDVLQFTITAPYLNGGTPVVLNYPTVAGDNNASTLGGHLSTFFLAGAQGLTAVKIFVTNSGKIVFHPPTGQMGHLTVSYSGSATIAIFSTPISSLGTGTRTFTYNYLLDAWIYLPAGGVYQCIPYEAVAELCNRVNAHLYYCWPLHTKSANVSSMANFFATNLNSNLRMYGEFANEVWNSFGGTPYGQLQHFASALALNSNLTAAVLGYAGLRTRQVNEIARTAWVSAGRAASDYYSTMMGQTTSIAISSGFDLYQMKGQDLDAAANTIYGTYGGFGGGSAPSYTASGSRPGDYADAVGQAPYWASRWWNYSANGTSNTSFDSSQGVTGALVDNAVWLQAALDYANGNVSTAFLSLYNQFNGTTTRASGSSGGITLTSYLTQYANQEAQVTQFDSQRASAGKAKGSIVHYEAGNQWACGADFNNGVNAASSKLADIVPHNNSDITNLANKMTSLAWNVSPYTVSGTDDKTEMATMTIQMQMGWKYDTDKNGAAANTGSYKNLVKIYFYQAIVGAHSGREVHPGQYSYNGGQWGYFYSTWDQSAPAYQSRNAATEFNA